MVRILITAVMAAAVWFALMHFVPSAGTTAFSLAGFNFSFAICLVALASFFVWKRVK